MDDCPVLPFIPIYLVVSGAISACVSVVCMMQIVFIATGNEHIAGVVLALCYLCDGVIGCFITIWFFIGECITCLCVLACICSA